MNKSTINKEELLELLEQDGTIEMSKMPTDHDYYLITSIVYKNNKTYRVNYESNNEDIFGEDFDDCDRPRSPRLGMNTTHQSVRSSAG